MPTNATEETNTSDERNVEHIDDRRSVIESAFDKAASNPDNTLKVWETVEGRVADTPEDTPRGDPAVRPGPVDTKGEARHAVAAEDKPEDEATKFSVDKPPQAWRTPQKAKWAALDPDVRQEVVRREREVTKVLSDSASARQLSNAFTQAISPYLARIESFGVHPIAAVQELMRTDHQLVTGNKVQKANMLAKLIADYDVDIETLDHVLAGKSPKQEDAVGAQVERMIAERMKPFNDMMSRQQQDAAAQNRQKDAEISETLDAMESDTVKYPHYSDVKEDMADIIEIQAKKKVYLSLDQAYNRAIAMNPELNQTAVSQRKISDANERAQKALKASKSVGGAPTGSATGAINASDRRATIAAAFEAHSGR